MNYTWESLQNIDYSTQPKTEILTVSLNKYPVVRKLVSPTLKTNPEAQYFSCLHIYYVQLDDAVTSLAVFSVSSLLFWTLQPGRNLLEKTWVTSLFSCSKNSIAATKKTKRRTEHLDANNTLLNNNEQIKTEIKFNSPWDTAKAYEESM